ncbi:MAG: hypothetical protein HXX08_06905 [Chloroflexi bacterium]|uniref:Uncharacterized protein n=1 Tax=Candidatus Chlorohelix allophototropha TaxID=3003348 RepID=A0A8T7M0X9_9CHLR|nr:hypothetical protein [Chloroflexota bacterium]WJW67463.1 hypothetical protein OZ401_000729 [Chloroflexota bacterium L227-S17]
MSKSILKIMLSVLAFLGAIQMVRGFLALFTPLVLDYTEQMLVAGTWQLEKTGIAAMYAPPNTPYGMPGIQYPPLFPVLAALLHYISGMSLEGAVRFCSFGGYIAAAIVAGFIVKDWLPKQAHRYNYLTIFLPFCFWPVIIYMQTARVDPLALFLSLSGAWLYLRNGYVKTTGLLFALAAFTKQTYLAAPIALLLSLLLAKKWKKAGIFTAAYILPLGIAYFATNILSDGIFFNIFDPSRAARFIFNLAPGMVFFFLLDHLPILILASAGVAFLWKKGQTFLPLYALFSALSCVTIIKDGAVDYYFTELVYLASIMTCIFLQSKNKDLNPLPATRSKLKRSLPTILIGIQCLIGAGMVIGYSQLNAANNFTEAYQEGATVIKDTPDSLVLADGALIANGYYDRAGDYLIYSIMLSSGKADSKLFVKDLEEKRWKQILTVTPGLYRWVEPIANALADNYEVKILRGRDGQGLYWIYTPKK